MNGFTMFNDPCCRFTQINRETNGDLTVTDITERKYPISKCFGLSIYNCTCGRRKTGLVLYPINTKFKNIVLLVCENCYGYQSNGGTQHDQLLQWYYGIYGGSTQYRCVSGFSQKDNGSLGFNSYSQNSTGNYTNGAREMGPIEQNIVRTVVLGKLDLYEA